MLEQDSLRIADAVAPRSKGHIDTSQWSTTRVRTGIVVGSVQSGKTANMLAVAAHVLDRGVGVLVVLAGTRVALWLQTYERLLQQLDGSSTSNSWARNKERVLIPDPNDILGEEGRADPRRYLNSQLWEFKKAVIAKRPGIIVVFKDDSHLLELGRFLRSALAPSVLEERGAPLEVVVLDDEADDGSVLDSEQGDKQTPRIIRHIWSDPQTPDETWHPSLFATYVAYTATPQANFLQAQHNPLAPRDFRASLRVPADYGQLSPRTTSYNEPEGVRRYYTGGRVFYELLSTEPGSLIKGLPYPVRRDEEEEAQYQERFRAHQWAVLGEGLRSYFVAGAIRLLLSGRSLMAALRSGPLDASALDAILPSPHSMLIHPSALKDLHFRMAEDVGRWCASIPGQEEQTPPVLESEGTIHLDPAGLSRRLTLEEDQWRAWHNHFIESTFAARLLPKGGYASLTRLAWSDIRTVLESEVFPGTKLRILNSDPRADDRPLFDRRPVAGNTNLFLPPPEIFSIFIAGNVLSRGLTIEGLCTSLFLRSANEPAADTQMQMQRWFGYRGEYLPFCRLFAYQDQLDLFRAYHLNDEAQKGEILAEMDSGEASPQGPLILQGENFVATSKVDTRRVPLHPGPSPSVKLVELADTALAQANRDILSNFLDSHACDELEVEGTLRGLMSREPIDMLEMATILEGFRYSKHRPDPHEDLYARWRSIQLAYGLQSPVLRLPPAPYASSGIDPSGCPYSIAAYLRLWNALLQKRDVRGLYPTDRPRMSWHHINLADYQATRPRFYVGVRFGPEGLSLDPRLRQHGIRVMQRNLHPKRDFLLNTLWGTRGEGGKYFGDQLLDYHLHASSPVPRLHDGVRWRTRGHPGLLLFHLVREAPGTPETLTVGLGIPHGGPDHVAALRGTKG